MFFSFSKTLNRNYDTFNKHIIILSVINSSSKPQHFTMDYVECPCASTARLCFVWKIAKYFISLRISRRYSHLKIPYRLQGHPEANNTCVRQVAHNFFENKYEIWRFKKLVNWANHNYVCTHHGGYKLFGLIKLWTNKFTSGNSGSQAIMNIWTFDFTTTSMYDEIYFYYEDSRPIWRLVPYVCPMI